MESTQKALLLYTGCPQGNALWATVWLIYWTSQFFHGSPIYEKEKLTENDGYSDLDVWKIFSWKWTKWVCQGELLAVVANDKIQAFKQKLKLQKTLICRRVLHMLSNI